MTADSFAAANQNTVQAKSTDCQYLFVSGTVSDEEKILPNGCRMHVQQHLAVCPDQSAGRVLFTEPIESLSV